MKFTLASLAGIATLVGAEISDDGYCRALAMRGGGTKGIYDVGVLEAFLENLPIEDIGYDVVTGVSIGAVNGGTLAIFEKGDEANAIALLKTYWNDTSTDGLFDEWPTFGPIAGFWKNSFLDMTPSHTRIKDRFMGLNFAREVAFQSVNANTGKVVQFEEDTEDDLQPEAVAASASIPIAFQPTVWDDMQMVDGGVYSNTNLEYAINKCKDLVDDYDKIIVDVLMCQTDPVEIGSYTKQSMFNALNIYNRKKTIKTYYDTMNDIYPFVRAFPEVNYRYIVAASETLPSSSVPIIVSQDDLEKSYSIGYKDGVDAISGEYGIKEGFTKMIENYESFILRDGW